MGEPGVAVGEIWRGNPPRRERLRIDRVWQGYDYRDREAWTVRAQPRHGGPVVIASPEWIIENYSREEANA